MYDYARTKVGSSQYGQIFEKFVRVVDDAENTIKTLGREQDSFLAKLQNLAKKDVDLKELDIQHNGDTIYGFRQQVESLRTKLIQIEDAAKEYNSAYDEMNLWCLKHGLK